MKARASILAAMIGFVACDDDRSAGGGGFETGNIRARVVSPSGKPAARALVWLVASQGDSAPARVIDSAWTNSAGIADLRIPLETGRLDLGLDARLEDSLGIAGGCPFRNDSAEVVLAPPGIVEAWIDSTRRIPTLFVPGSHFSSTTSTSEPKSVLRLPQGTWDVVLKTPAKSEVLRGIGVGTAIERVGAPAWSTKPLVWSDSLAIPSLMMAPVVYLDTNLVPPHEWSRWRGSIDGRRYSDSLVSRAGDATTLMTSLDSANGRVQVGSAIASPRLPARGAILLAWESLHEPGLDSGSVRVVTLIDSIGNGVRLNLAKGRSPATTVTTLGETLVTEDSIATFPDDPIQAAEWIVAWNAKYIEIRQGRRLVARCYSGWYQAGEGSSPSMNLELGSDRIGLEAGYRITSLKLYQPN